MYPAQIVTAAAAVKIWLFNTMYTVSQKKETLYSCPYLC